ncbi:unnamed protein product [Rotaria socialis]
MCEQTAPVPNPARTTVTEMTTSSESSTNESLSSKPFVESISKSATSSTKTETKTTELTGIIEDRNQLTPSNPFRHTSKMNSSAKKYEAAHHTSMSHTDNILEMPSKLRNTKKGNFQYSHAVLSGIRSIIQSITKFGVHTVAHMSACGFRYTGNGNAACCKDCGLEVSNLTSDMNPFTIHSQRRPDCPFAKLIRPAASSINVGDGKSTVNASDIGPLLSNDILMRTSCNPAYSEIPKRHASYATWPIEDLPPVDDLVRAGFFYTGTKSIVTCFYCNGSLQNWGPNDNPMIEHARWFPHCAYARKLCGEELYRNIQESKRAQQEHARANESKDRTVRNDVPNTNAPSLPPTTNGRQLLIPDESTLSKLVADRVDLPISRRLIDQNFKLSIIRQCWTDQLRIKLLRKQTEHIDVMKENIVIPSVKMKQIREQKARMREQTFIVSKSSRFSENSVNVTCRSPLQ